MRLDSFVNHLEYDISLLINGISRSIRRHGNNPED